MCETACAHILYKCNFRYVCAYVHICIYSCVYMYMYIYIRLCVFEKYFHWLIIQISYMILWQCYSCYIFISESKIYHLGY